MIKNKTPNIKIIYKIYLKIFYVFEQIFILQKLKNSFQKLFFRIFFFKIVIKYIACFF